MLMDIFIRCLLMNINDVIFSNIIYIFLKMLIGNGKGHTGTNKGTYSEYFKLNLRVSVLCVSQLIVNEFTQYNTCYLEGKTAELKVLINICFFQFIIFTRLKPPCEVQKVVLYIKKNAFVLYAKPQHVYERAGHDCCFIGNMRLHIY